MAEYLFIILAGRKNWAVPGAHYSDGFLAVRHDFIDFNAKTRQTSLT